MNIQLIGITENRGAQFRQSTGEGQGQALAAQREPAVRIGSLPWWTSRQPSSWGGRRTHRQGRRDQAGSQGCCFRDKGRNLVSFKCNSNFPSYSIPLSLFLIEQGRWLKFPTPEISHLSLLLFAPDHLKPLNANALYPARVQQHVGVCDVFAE